MFLRFCSQNTHMIRDREAPVRMQGLHVGPRSARRRVGGSPWAFQMKRKLVSRCRRGQAQGCLPTAHQLQPEEEDFQSHTAGKQLTPITGLIRVSIPLNLQENCSTILTMIDNLPM